MDPVVLVTWPDFATAWSGGTAALERAGLSVRLAPRLGHRTSAEVDELLGDAVAAIVSTDPFTPDVLAAHPDLEIIARVGVGFDSVDIPAADRHGVLVTTTPGANEAAVADHTLGLMLATLRRIPEHDSRVRAGRWSRTGAHMSWQLAGSVVGLVGFGGIGRQVATRLHGFGVTVLAHDPAFAGESDVQSVTLPDLLRRSDVVSLHAPLLPSTRGLIGPREIGMMKRSAVLINTGRGGIVDEQALAFALAQGRLRYAAVDVFEEEPPWNSPLLTLENVVLTPHVAGVSDVSVAEMVERSVHAVIDTRQGRTPADIVNPGAVDAWRARRAS